MKKAQAGAAVGGEREECEENEGKDYKECGEEYEKEEAGGGGGEGESEEYMKA